MTKQISIFDTTRGVTFLAYLIGFQHSVEPREKPLGAMQGIQHHGDAVELGHLADVERHGNCSSDGRQLGDLVVVDATAGYEGGAFVGYL